MRQIRLPTRNCAGASSKPRWRQAAFPVERARFWGFLDQDAVRHLRELKEAVHALLVEHRPEVVLTHPYEGGHPDHDAVAFAVHAAAGGMPAPARPALLEMAYYHDGAGGEVWGGFAGHPGSAIVLDGPALARKHSMVGCYRSQERVLARFPLNVERVRLAPDYDFTAAPPPGRFQYDAHGWGCAAVISSRRSIPPTRRPPSSVE